MSKEKMQQKKHTSYFTPRTSNKGITLVALIITIVVMLILVAVTLSIALGDNGILNTSKEAKEQTEISKEKEQLIDAVFATAGSNGEVDLEKIVLPEGFKEISRDGNKVVYQGPSGQLYEVENITGKIIEIDGIEEDLKITTDTQGVTFTKSDGVTPGDPYKLQKGDIVTYGDYKYTYSGNSWSVAVLDKTKEKYGKIAEEIYGKPITSLANTFSFCTNLISSPDIPNTVKDMKLTYEACKSLKEAAELPEQLTSMNHTFYGCSSLKVAPSIPETVTVMTATFYGCSSLIEPPKIPSRVTTMGSAFRGCNSMKIAPEIPNGVKDINQAFQDCKSLIETPEIPNSVTSMNLAFGYCTSLKIVSEIPESVTSMNNTFYSCINLQGEFIINASPTTYTNCFYNAGTQGTGIVLKGESTVLNELAATNTHGKVTVGN